MSFKCENCGCDLQKADAEFVDEENFAYLPQPPLKPGTYCPQCFEAHVRPALIAYGDLVEKAGNVNVFYLSQSKESRFVRRTERPVQVQDCQDREEVVMRLAFLTAQMGKNSLVDVDLKAEKVRNGSYQTSKWSGRGIPAHIDEGHLARRFRGVPN